MNRVKSPNQQQQEASEKLATLWEARKDRLSLTQKKVAKFLGVSQPTVFQYLHRQIPLTTDAVLAFARLLRVLPEEISIEVAAKLRVISP